MTTRGPKPVPDNVHAINGNPSKKRLAVTHTGARVPVVIPDRPSYITGVARKEWDRVTSILQQLGIVSEIDRGALEAYCQLYARWRKIDAAIAKAMKEDGIDGLIDVTPSKYRQIGVPLQMWNRCLDQLKIFWAEFGMTPSARSRVDINLQGDLFGDSAPQAGDNGDGGDDRNPASEYFRPR